MYTINIERKRLLKQRREKALQNTKDRKLAKENFLTALKAGHKADRASNDTQSSAHSNDELINGANTDTIIWVDNIDNIEIVAENATNTTTNADNIDNAEIKDGKPEEVVMSDDNIDNAAMSNNNTDEATLGNDNAGNVQKVTLVSMTYHHLYFMAEKQQIQAKSKPLKSIDLFRSSP